MPTFEHENDEEEEETMKVHNNKLNSPPFKVNFNNKKMKTIKEEREDGDHENNSDQSDTGYFGEETYDFNNSRGPIY